MMRRYADTIGRQLRAAAHNVVMHGEVPGYSQLPWHSRCKLNVLAFVVFLRSAACLHMLCAAVAWLLVSYILVWTHNLRGFAATALPSTALFWLLPWLAAIRRRQIGVLLDNRWEHGQLSER